MTVSIPQNGSPLWILFSVLTLPLCMAVHNRFHSKRIGEKEMTSNDRLQQTVAFREQLLHGLDYASTSRRKDARFLASLFQELASLFQLSTYVFAPATHGRLTNFFETSIQDKRLI